MLFGKLPTLLLRKFNVDENSDNLFVEIEGRPSGLLSWILSLLKLDDITRLEVSKDNVSFKTASLSGETINLIPLKNTSFTSCGFQKPFSLLVCSVIMILMALGALFSGESAWVFLLFIIFALGFSALYIYKKSLSIVIHCSGGHSLGLRFKRSIIENVDVNIEKVKLAIDIINKNIVNTRR